MVLFLAWSLSRAQQASMADALAEADAMVVRHDESLDTGDLIEGARDFALAYYGRVYFDVLRAVFGRTYPALADVEDKQLEQLAKRLDKARASYQPDPDALTPAIALQAVREAGAALADHGFAWSTSHQAFVRTRGHLRAELATSVGVRDARRGETGVRIFPRAAVFDDRVDDLIATLPADHETACLRDPVLERRAKEVVVPHRGKLAAAAVDIMGQLVELIPWLDGMADDAAVLAAFRDPLARGADAGWPCRRGLFAVLTGQETVDAAGAFIRSQHGLGPVPARLWKRCVQALAIDR